MRYNDEVLIEQVKSLAQTKYNYTFGEHEIVSHHVATFFDAVLLYAYALNTSISEIGDKALNEPLNGTVIFNLILNCCCIYCKYPIFLEDCEFDVGSQLSRDYWTSNY